MALVDALIGGGVEVTALARTDAGARRLRDQGASVVRGDITDAPHWRRAARASDVVFHTGLPRMVPPLRGRHVRRLARMAESDARIIADVARGDVPVVLAACALGDRRGPLTVAEPGLAAERALGGPLLRVVRLPWLYGSSGFVADMARGLAMRRFRIVGPGANRITLASARDGAAALVAAASAPPGTYVVAEDDLPTQVEIVHHICIGRGVPRPDHVPPRMASLSMGGVLVEALMADQVAAGPGPPGFRPAHGWREDLLDQITGE